jgi:hypothetical protein
MSAPMPIGTLRKLSILYLLLPNILFAAGWFRQPYALLVVLGYGYLFICEFQRKDHTEIISRKDILVVLIFACIWIFFSGVGGYTRQSFDWPAHNAKFYDLYKNGWPIYFQEVGRYATYYFGYYLVPAIVSKWAGMLLPAALVVWTLAGFFLGLLWMYILLRRNPVLLLLFFFMRGTGQLFNYILQYTPLGVQRAPDFIPSVRAVFEQSRFVPNQLIPVLICCGMLVYGLLNRKKNDGLFFPITLMFIWGIFPAISTLGIYGMITLHRYIFSNDLTKQTCNELLGNFILPGVLFLPTLTYFLSSDGAILSGFLFSFEPSTAILITYVTGVLLDLLLLYVLANALNKEPGLVPRWFINSLLAVVFALSLFRLGKFNDLFYRGAYPFCIILFIAILRGAGVAFEKRKMPGSFLFYPVALFMVCLALAQIKTIMPRLLRDNVATNYFLGAREKFASPPFDTYSNTYQALMKGYKDEAGARQYLAAEHSWYQKYLSRNSQPTPFVKSAEPNNQ